MTIEYLKEFKGIHIRTVNKSDLNKIDEWIEFIGKLIEEDVMINANYVPSHYEEHDWIMGLLDKYNKKIGIYLVAEKNGEKIAGCNVSSEIGKSAHIATIGIAVHKNFRGIGLGKELLNTIMELAKKELKTTPIQFRLGCFEQNTKAINVYKRLGFTQVAIVPKQYLHKGEYQDELIFIKNI